jgi:hypothetical protein
MRHATISSGAALLVIGFLSVYCSYLIRVTVRTAIDVYDLYLLSFVAVAPTLVVVFPGLSYRISSSLGVKFPLTLLFGLLISISFLLIMRLAVARKRQERTIALLVQEMSILKMLQEARTGDNVPGPLPARYRIISGERGEEDKNEKPVPRGQKRSRSSNRRA